MSKSDPAQSVALVTFETDNGEVALSPQIVRDYLVNGQGRVTDQEVQLFLRLCQYQRLNPFLREAYLIKYGDSQPATIVTGKEVFTKRAARHPQFAGQDAGVIATDSAGAVIERSGAAVFPGETLVGGWAKVYRADRKVPTCMAVTLAEYAKVNARGELQKNWRDMPATMIRKVALVQALREAFPEQLQGLYSEEEEAPIAEVKPTRVEVMAVVGATSAPRADVIATDEPPQRTADPIDTQFTPIDEPAAQNATEPWTTDTKRTFYKLMEQKGMVGPYVDHKTPAGKERLEMVSEFTKFHVGKARSTEITEADGQYMLDTLFAMPDRTFGQVEQDEPADIFGATEVQDGDPQ